MMKSSRLKVAFIAPGSINHTVKWVNGLVDLDLDVTLVTQHKVEVELDPRVEVINLPITGGLGYLLNAYALNRAIHKIQPDIINVHYASGYGTLALLSCIKPYILSVWGSDVYEFPYQSNFKMWLINRTLCNAEHIASTSHAMASQVCNLLEDKSLDISITPFGVDLTRFKPMRPIFSNNSITVGIVKRLEHKYGVDLLIAAFKLVQEHFSNQANDIPRLILKIVGDGSKEEDLKAQAEALSIASSIDFVGSIDNSQVCEVINDMDIFVVPSRIESFGVSAIEAMACERPCIVANTGGLPEVVSYGKVGLIAKYESVQDIAAKIIYLVEHKVEAQQLAIKAREHVLAHYGNKAALETMHDLYQRFYNEPRL
ncbi:glycosyltransferase [Thalassotalea euphylliae]|uniref:Glycosyltransferase family 4 protein n=1 Tax=Thalassotalea euphylliae TaxID=1655234 RepID=A0A3E0UEA0_9GAMM|nr:glycosyltransferase [Thalassotalea euphylliae]REL34903.1 glycosyltransferase family 4 protein [Thalassotalea euphylliae]